MLFSERKEISDKYEKWIQENKAIKDCPFSVVTYLDMFGYLTPPKREEKIVKYENAMTKDEFKRIFENPSITDDFYKCIQTIEQEWNLYLNERALAENKTPGQICDEIMNGYKNMTWEGEDDGKRDS